MSSTVDLGVVKGDTGPTGPQGPTGPTGSAGLTLDTFNLYDTDSVSISTVPVGVWINGNKIDGDERQFGGSLAVSALINEEDKIAIIFSVEGGIQFYPKGNSILYNYFDQVRFSVPISTDDTTMDLLFKQNEYEGFTVTSPSARCSGTAVGSFFSIDTYSMGDKNNFSILE